MTAQRVIFGLGSNLGNRQPLLQQAVDKLCTSPSLALSAIRLSSIYESPALLPDHAGPDWDRPFLNMALAADTTATALDILPAIKAIETELGRLPAERWAPRPIDIDLLALGEQTLNTPALTLPHPGLPERAFALLPFAELEPAWQWPVKDLHYGNTAQELAERPEITNADCTRSTFSVELTHA